MSGSSNSNASKSTPQATPQQMLGIYNNYLPQSLATTVNQAQPVANSLAGAAANANPIYTASGLNQLNTYAPGYAQAGSNVAQQQALGGADNLAGAGGLYSLEGAGLTNLLNPAQAANNGGAASLINSFNMNGLSGGEQAAAERSLNQSNYATGNLGIDNATNAVSNAMNFGNALAAKRAQLGSALTATNNVASSQNTAFNPIQAITGITNPSNNFGLSQFNGTQANSNLTAPLSFGSSLGNQIAGVSSASDTKSSGGGASGGLCCFIFIEAYGHEYRIPIIVRRIRDVYYRKMPKVAVGYKRMAKILVPLMRQSNLVRWIVQKTMISPLTDHGFSIITHNPEQQYKKIRKFWFRVWSILGSV